MRIVWSWLKELVEVPREMTAADGAAALTRVGFEVESLERLAPGFKGVVIAEVVSKKPHPKAEKLTLVEVRERAGAAKALVVCGASNVPAPGGRVLWARPGSSLPGGIEIGEKALKGVTSSGMLCSETELGLGEDGAGICVLGPEDQNLALGADVGEAFRLEDSVLEVNVPANRPDALGHFGIARELAAAVSGRLKKPEVSFDGLTKPAEDREQIAVAIEDKELCSRYVARVITNLQVGPSPVWLRTRLRAVGVRSISNLVDVTNYVMFELGQPLHAFDFDRLRGATIGVRLARAGEKLKTLDNALRVLERTDIVITDPKGPIALAGVMGGADSEVESKTTRIVLEAATFLPTAVRKTSRRLGLLSEASYRFERGVDDAGVDIASRRAARLLCEVGRGQVSTAVVDDYPAPAPIRKVSLRSSRASALTGLEISRDQASQVLSRLEIQVESDPVRADVLEATIPTFRSDLSREVDLIEDVLRHIGFDRVPTTLMQRPHVRTREPDARPNRAREALLVCGFHEAITFGFFAEQRLKNLGLDGADPRSAPLRVRNPMTVDQAVMRTSLLPNLFAAVAHNRKHDVADIKLFEVGSVFLPREEEPLPKEPWRVAGVACGHRRDWLGPGPLVDFFDVKAGVLSVLESLLGEEVRQVRFVAEDGIPYLHPGVAAVIEHPKLGVLGEVGEIHPRTRRAFEIDVPCFAFDLDLELLPQPLRRQMAAIPRFPAIARDVSFFVGAELPAAQVAEKIAAARAEFLVAVECLEDYRDPEKVPPGKKGMLWSLLYRAPDRTLTDAEVDAVHEALVRRILGDLGATRR